MSGSLVWLWTHCRAIGMRKSADRAPEIEPMAMDVALFTATQKEQLDEATALLREWPDALHWSTWRRWKARREAFLARVDSEASR